MTGDRTRGLSVGLNGHIVGRMQSSDVFSWTMMSDPVEAG